MTTSKPRAAKRRKPKPMPVVITKQPRTLKDITLFEIGLLPFIYLEGLVKLIISRFSPKAS